MSKSKVKANAVFCWQIGFDLLIIWPFIYFGAVLDSILALSVLFIIATFFLIMVIIVSFFKEDMQLSDIENPVAKSNFDVVRKWYHIISTTLEVGVMYYYGSYIIASIWLLIFCICYKIITNRKPNLKTIS